MSIQKCELIEKEEFASLIQAGVSDYSKLEIFKSFSGRPNSVKTYFPFIVLDP